MGVPFKHLLHEDSLVYLSLRHPLDTCGNLRNDIQKAELAVRVLHMHHDVFHISETLSYLHFLSSTVTCGTKIYSLFSVELKK